MKTWLEKVPYPLAGLMLAYAALGNYLAVFFGDTLKNFCGFLATLILVILVLKVTLLPKSLEAALKQLPIIGVLNTFPMGLILLSAYLKSYVGQGAVVLWAIGVGLNVAVMIFFTVKHLLPFRMEKVLANYFVTYVGIVCASVTAGAFQAQAFGKLAFLFGLIAYGISFVLVTYRYAIKKVTQEALKPLVIIYAAPANLLVVGYLSLGLQWSELFLITLWGIGLLTTLFAYYQLILQRKFPFYPSFSAYTFPLVIGAIASIRVAKVQREIDTFDLSKIAQLIGEFQGVIAVLIVLRVTYLYIRFLVIRKKA